MIFNKTTDTSKKENQESQISNDFMNKQPSDKKESIF